MKITNCLLTLGLAATMLGCTDPNTPTTPVSALSDNSSLKATRVVARMPRSQKRGVSFSIGNLEDALLLSECIAWHYNWGNTPGNSGDVATFLEANDIDYCPMCWSGNYSADRIRTYVKAHPNTKYLLGFNEPNLTDQANMTPAQAAEKWPAVVALAKELNLQLGAPAMNYGTLAGYSDPIKWLDEFFRQPGCSIDDIDFLPIHCYMMNPSAVKGYVEKFQKYNKPIWMTEFCAWESVSGVEQQKSYMSDVINYFEREPSVARYAWFMPRMNASLNSKPYNQLLTKTSPVAWTPLGEIFCGLSSQDKSVCLDASYAIPAVAYSDYNTAPAVLNSTDTEAGRLMLYALSADHWVEYQVAAPQQTQSLTIRYATSVATDLAVYVDGGLLQMVSLPKTGSFNTWSTSTIPNVVMQGKHYLRLHIVGGNANISQFKLN